MHKKMYNKGKEIRRYDDEPGKRAESLFEQAKHK